MTKRAQENLSMLTDFYELTMGNGYLEHGLGDRIAYFDMYYRTVPDGGSFAIACGLETAIEYLKDLHFDEGDIQYFRDRNIFDERFLEYLRNFRFSCDVWALPEGTVVFPNEPIVIVRGPVIQASLVETMILLTINHQSLIATKTSRIVRAANGRPVMEFGSRRAQGPDAATLGAKAAYIAGAAGTANTLADRRFGVPALGTMAHSWVMMFPSEYDAFKAYAEIYPDNCVLLVDTYDTLHSGVPNAIRIFKEVLGPMGYRPGGIRLDSGDIAYLSKRARKMLDEAGFPDATIVASNSLDEYKIEDILMQNAQINSFGVGENLITSRTYPVFGGVYKLVALENNGEIISKIKISENVGKITTPGFKNVWRLYDRRSDKAIADVITLHDEVIDDSGDYEIFHPVYTWKRKNVTYFRARPLLVRIFEAGNLVYDVPSLEERREYCAAEVESLWDEYKRFDNPHIYKVDLSQRLWDLKNELLEKAHREVIEIRRAYGDN